MTFRERLFLKLSAAVNVIFFRGKWPESLSARAYREGLTNEKWANRMRIIDRILGAGHCQRVYLLNAK